MGQSNAETRRRIEWLADHPRLWRGLDLNAESHQFRLKTLVQAMQQAGLYSKRTHWYDVALRRLLPAAKAECDARVEEGSTWTT